MRHIGILKDNKITFVKYDGPGFVKDVLIKHYRTSEKIEELIAKGDVLGVNDDGLFYHSENPSGPHQTDSLDEFDEGSENYLFNCDKASSSNGYIKQGQWTLSTPTTRALERLLGAEILYMHNLQCSTN